MEGALLVPPALLILPPLSWWKRAAKEGRSFRAVRSGPDGEVLSLLRKKWILHAAKRSTMSSPVSSRSLMHCGCLVRARVVRRGFTSIGLGATVAGRRYVFTGLCFTRFGRLSRKLPVTLWGLARGYSLNGRAVAPTGVNLVLSDSSPSTTSGGRILTDVCTICGLLGVAGTAA